MKTRTMLTFPALFAASALALAGCSSLPDDSATTPPPSEDTASATPTATQESPPETEEPADDVVYAHMPTCDEIAALPAVQAAVGDGIEMEDGTQAQPKEGATTELYCSWFGGDISGGHIQLNVVTPENVEAYVGQREADGATCTEADGVTTCELTEPVEGYPAEQHYVDRFEGQQWIEVYSSNLDFRPAVPEILELVNTQ